MSWKSLVTASLLCVLASPVFAVPQLEITSGGLDPTTGNWIWNVRIAPTTNTTPVATELGFGANGALKSVANASPASWDTNTAGNSIFGWELPYNTPAKPNPERKNAAGSKGPAVDSLCSFKAKKEKTNDNAPTGKLT